MEQKKTLWIIAAVGAFLLVVLGGVGILYSPAKNTTPTISSVTPVVKQNNDKDSSGWINNSENNSGALPVGESSGITATQKVNEMIVVSDNTTVYDLQNQKPSETTIDLNALKSELAASNSATTPVQIPAQPQNINITVTLPEVETKTPVVQESVPVKVQPAETAKSEPVPVKSVQAKSANVKKVTKSAAKEPAPVVKAEPKKITQYWVQVASYSNKKGAENAREILDSNKIPSDIFTYKDNKDKLYFRVRVGPYTTKSEAEYWQSRIMKIPYFEKNDSYITSTVK